MRRLARTLGTVVAALLIGGAAIAQDLENMLQSLKDMAAKSDKWAPEILDKVRGFEEGWSAVERDFDEDKLRHEIEYWQGVLGLEEIE